MFKPNGCRILVKVNETNHQKKIGNLLLPDNTTTDNSTLIGEVVEVGNGRYNSNNELIPIQYVKGDIVYFPKYSATELVLDSEKYYLVEETVILGVETC